MIGAAPVLPFRVIDGRRRRRSPRKPVDPIELKIADIVASLRELVRLGKANTVAGVAVITAAAVEKRRQELEREGLVS